MQPLGVLLIAYLKLKLRLQVAGYDAEFYDFDWRQSIADLGKELKVALEGRAGRNASTWSRTAWAAWLRAGRSATARSAAAVMLGTPNYGSFAPVEALRGTYSVVKKVAALDVRHSAEELARDVFSTFPGLTQHAAVAGSLTKTSTSMTSRSGRTARAFGRAGRYWTACARCRSRSRSGRRAFYLIAGVDQRTVTGLRPTPRGSFTTSRPRATGPCPSTSRVCRACKTYYVAESHGSLPNNKVVAQAVLDLLDRGGHDDPPRHLRVRPTAEAPWSRCPSRCCGRRALRRTARSAPQPARAADDARRGGGAGCKGRDLSRFSRGGESGGRSDRAGISPPVRPRRRRPPAPAEDRPAVRPRQHHRRRLAGDRRRLLPRRGPERRVARARPAPRRRHYRAVAPPHVLGTGRRGVHDADRPPPDLSGPHRFRGSRAVRPFQRGGAAGRGGERDPHVREHARRGVRDRALRVGLGGRRRLGAAQPAHAASSAAFATRTRTTTSAA